MSYTKLFNSIVTSTLWMEDDRTRIVWITMLAIADKNGEIQASVPGLARLAAVPLDDCRAAITKFLSPDLDSRTKDDQGRRIEEIDGGWALLNFRKYREMASKEESQASEASRKARYRAKMARNVPKCPADVPRVPPVSTVNPHIAEAEAEADNKEEEPSAPVASKKAEIPIPALLDTPEFRAVWADWEQHRREKKQTITPTTRNRQLKNMAEIGVVRAIAAIEESISQGWQGIYEPKGGVAAGGIPIWKRMKDLEEEEKSLAGRLHQFFDREADPAGVARLTAVRLELSKLKT
jgi:hypothetical protein